MESNFDVFVFDDLPPEAAAMTQALYSRDPRSVIEHRKRVAEVGADKFMGSYYVGYGHKSIGDCGSVDIFIENVSMLVAKAVQDWPLYSGQEASTRYLDMANQPLVNPHGSDAGQALQEAWMSMYRHALSELMPFLKERFPRQAEQSERVYEKAIAAKAFDIARGFLPAGVATLLSWHTNLRQAHDHLQWLEHYPLGEVRDVARSIREKLQEKYPNSFSHKIYEQQERYLDYVSQKKYFHNPKAKKFTHISRVRVKDLLKDIPMKVISGRPEKSELPHKLAKYGTIHFSFPLDFGSFRDLQRHRNGSFEMPLLTTRIGFHPWYLAQLSPALAKDMKRELAMRERELKALKASKEVAQYYIAMGYQVSCDFEIGLPSAVYIAELRSQQTVHPTLRVVAQEIGRAVAKILPSAVLYIDQSPDFWDVRRGTQDIIKK